MTTAIDDRIAEGFAGDDAGRSDGDVLTYDDDIELESDAPVPEWVVGMIEHGEINAIREALSDSQDSERKALRKWMRADERYGGRIRSLRAEYEQHRVNTTALFTAATSQLA